MSEQPFVERRRSWNASVRDHFRELEEQWNRAHPPLAIVHCPPRAQAAEEPPQSGSVVLPPECLSILETRRPNLLLIGPAGPIAAVMQVIERSLIRPVVSCHAGRLAVLPQRIGTLVVHDADRLSRDQQAELHSWLNRHADKQVITIAMEPLFSLVVRNLFSDVLFYRLNAVSLIVDDAPQIT